MIRPPPHSLRVDLNADVGETDHPDGGEAALMARVTSVNVACGGHAGDAATMRATLRAAGDLGLAVGAHPSYPDRAGFGRRPMEISAGALADAVRDQMAALAAIAAAEGLALRHVKPHGALYHRAAEDVETARALVAAVAAIDRSLAVVGPAGSVLAAIAAAAGLPTLREAFADRAVHADGRLVPRGTAGAVLADPRAAAERAVRMVRDGRVAAHGGGEIAVAADTLCIHGDSPGAAAIAAAVRDALVAAGIRVATPWVP